MEPEEITAIYETLAPVAGNYANAQAEQIGMAQSSMGPLAQAAMGQSQTAGLGNYTYNRLMRPQVDAMRDELLVQGYTNQLNRALSDALTSAKQNYSRSQRAAAMSSSGGGGTTTGGSKYTTEVTNPQQVEQKAQPQASDYVGETEFSNYGNLFGQTGKYPLTVDTPTFSTSYNQWKASHGNDESSRAQNWVNYLYSLGYRG